MTRAENNRPLQLRATGLAKRNGATEGRDCLDVNGAIRRMQNFACPGFGRSTEKSLDWVALLLAKLKHRNHRQEGSRAARLYYAKKGSVANEFD